MLRIRELKTADRDRIPAVAKLHKQAFEGFFLTQLGIPFLKALYTGYLEAESSGLIAAEEDGKLLGFIAYSKDYPRFYRELMRRHLLRFAFCSAGAALRHPSFVKRLLGAFRKSESVVREERYVELASICVDPKIEGRGIGSALIDHLKGMVDFSEYAYINLETDAQNNDAANRFYVRNGFALHRQFVTAEGRRMNEYRYSGATASD